MWKLLRIFLAHFWQKSRESNVLPKNFKRVILTKYFLVSGATLWKSMKFASTRFLTHFFQIFRQFNVVKIYVVKWVLQILNFRHFGAKMRKKTFHLQNLEVLSYQNHLRLLTIINNEVNYSCSKIVHIWKVILPDWKTFG